MNNPTFEVNPTAQLMFIQSRAHHEDRIIHSKPTVDNKLKDFSHLLRPSNPSKKNYIIKEKMKKINQDNVNLLSKIYKITFDKSNEPVGKFKIPPKKPRKEEGASIELHPFSSDHRSRSLNNANRRKELEKINKDNSQLLNKLRTMKPTVPIVSECKQRKKKLEYLKHLIHKRDDDQQNRVLQPYINQKVRGDSVLNQYIQRHEYVGRRNSMTTNHEAIYVTNENHNESGVNIKAKNGRRNRRIGSKENLDEKNTTNMNSSEILSRSVDPDYLIEHYASDYQANSSKRTPLPPVTNKKTIEDIDKKMNLNINQDVSIQAQEAEIHDETEANQLKSIREDDIREELSHGESTNRDNARKNLKSLNRTNPH